MELYTMNMNAPQHGKSILHKNISFIYILHVILDVNITKSKLNNIVV